MKIQLISLFPQMFEEVLSSSMMLKAKQIKAVEFSLINLRQFGKGPRKQVDDTPYGGGDGMLLMVEPIYRAITAAKQVDPEAVVILPTPRGSNYNQSEARKLAEHNKGLIIVCPRYEGYDERITTWVDKSYCIGPYVLTGGEIPAMVITDSVVRLLPNVLGGLTSAINESFEEDNRTREYPQYTRPEEFMGLKVPEVLLNGHHQKISDWRSDNRLS